MSSLYSPKWPQSLSKSSCLSLSPLSVGITGVCHYAQLKETEYKTDFCPSSFPPSSLSSISHYPTSLSFLHQSTPPEDRRFALPLSSTPSPVGFFSAVDYSV